MRKLKYIKPDKTSAWEEFLHLLAFIIAIIAPFLLPTVLLIVVGPLACIVAAVLCFFFYFWVRPRSGGFGPMWLTMVDMYVLLSAIVDMFLAISAFVHVASRALGR